MHCLCRALIQQTVTPSSSLLEFILVSDWIEEYLCALSKLKQLIRHLEALKTEHITTTDLAEIQILKFVWGNQCGLIHAVFAWLCISRLLIPHGFPQEELEDKAGEKNIWARLLSLVPTTQICGQEKVDGWMDLFWKKKQFFVLAKKKYFLWIN